MKRKFFITFSLILFFSGLFAQEIIMDLGGANYSGVFETEPLKKFSEVKWRIPIKGRPKQNCVIKNGVLYISSVEWHKDRSKTGHIYAISSKDGSIVWEKELDKNVSSPSIKENVLYYGSDELEGTQYAVDIESGKIKWEFSTIQAACWPPAILGDKNYFGCHGDKFYVINNNSGELIHERDIDGGVCCRPSVANGIMFFTTRRNGVLHAMDPVTYQDLWTFNSGAGSNNAPSVVNGTAFMINKEGSIFAIDTKTGKQKWTYKTDDSMFRSPAIKDGIATLITTNGHIFAFNTENGDVIWDIKKSGKGYTNTVIVDNIVYVGCGDNHLYALDLKSGKELWNYESDNPVHTPFVDSGVVYFISGNYFYAIK